ncbi:MAG: alkaline phosphatase family protein [Acidobacteria bacterium]|nr:alkaline phosphatase family protein [Acidobacteriota bacterium]
MATLFAKFVDVTENLRKRMTQNGGKRTGPLCWIPLLAALVALLPGAQNPASSPPHVVLISIDGLLPEYYVRPQEFGLRVPNLQSLRDAGSWADAVVGQYPSVTYPAHTSIVTGVRPARHGIVYNTLFDPLEGSQRRYQEASHIQVPTLWDLARARGLKTGAVFWPVSATGAIDYLIPEAGPIPKGTAPEEFYRMAATPGLVDAIVGKSGAAILESPFDAERQDQFAAAAAVHILRAHRPALTLVHFIVTDSAQHRYGKHSAQALRAFELTDARVGSIVQAVREAEMDSSTTFIITGDHGFSHTHSALQPNVILRRAGLIQADADGKISDWQAVAHGGAVRLKDPSDDELARRVEKIFRDLADGQYRGVLRILDRLELDALGAYPEALLMLEPVQGYSVSASFVDDAFVIPSAWPGNHGYLPAKPDMHTGLITAGAGIRPHVRVPLARQIDIAPTVARLLGLQFQQIDGIPLVGILHKVPP